MPQASTAQNTQASDTGDLSQYYDIFFAEAGEHLEQMESLLLAVDIAQPDKEELNAIFRVAHSIKGGSATFGFDEIASLTHEMETVFDLVRKGEMVLSRDLVDAFLASGDMLKRLLARRRGDGDGAADEEVRALCTRLRGFLGGPAVPPAKAPARAAAPAQTAAPAPAAAKASKPRHVLDLILGPYDKIVTAGLVDGVVRDLAGFGEVTDLTDSQAKTRSRRTKTPRSRHLRLVTDMGLSDMVDTLGFMLAPEKVKASLVETIDVPVESAANGSQDYEIFRPEARGGAAAAAPAAEAAPGQAGPQAAPASAGSESAPVAKGSKAAAADASIRVNVSKVDQLINMVGELVITQAMLAQSAGNAGAAMTEALENGLAQLERNTRDLQEAAMSIRMMPMSVVFSRFPRLVRDLAGKLGKDIELRTEGEHTELDKGLIEHIVDPLTHLVRNSLDHGIELPAEREAKGKPAQGRVTLRAFHQGGNIVIEVADDGAGLDRAKLLAKAKERGMAVSDAMSDQEVWQLIFEAGFSTAKVVTDVSGRGVGMDVVRRNIKELGGRIEIESTYGAGTRMVIRLPLTLAILDGMSVRVGSEVYIIPLANISESLQPAPEAIRGVVSEGHVIEVRGEYLPVVSVREVFEAQGDALRWQDGIMVIIETEGGKTALFVDELVGQHQVVIKSLEANYRKVPGVSGATIMGDGRVALILDVAHFVGLSRSRSVKAA